MGAPVNHWQHFKMTFFIFILLIGYRCTAIAVDWKNINLKELELPSNVEDLKQKVDIKQQRIDVTGVDLYYQSAQPPTEVAESGKVILLLHGAAFSSQTWVDRVETISTLASLGHRVLAIDLPGFSRSKSRGSVRNKGKFLTDVIETLTPDVKPVVVTPSASGAFISQFLQQYKDKLAGWIPVAPVSISSDPAFYHQLDLPTLIVYGEKDSGARRSNNLLAQIPTSTNPQELPRAGHPAYLDQPQLWHQLLFNFL